MSTFCRSCGEHFTIKDGEVVQPDASSISGIASMLEPTEGGKMVRVPGVRKPVQPAPKPEKKPTISHMLAAKLKHWAAPLRNRLRGLSEHSTNSESATNDGERPKFAKQTATTDQRPVRCFDCGHLQHVSPAARSTICSRCSVYISLEDYHITTRWSQNVHTRGDISIDKNGAMVGCDITCHHLTVFGKLSASVDCSGDANFRGKTDSRVLGNMYCRHLRVDKKCKLHLPQGLIAESVDVYGQLDGNILCSGTVRIFKSGTVLGDATARSIILKDGAILTGQMDIQPEVEIPLPPKRNRH